MFGIRRLLKKHRRRVHGDGQPPVRSIDGTFMVRVMIVGHSSALTRLCVEDLLLAAADELGVGLTFARPGETCDIGVLCDDHLLGANLGSYYSILRDIDVPLFGFGVGSEAPLRSLDWKNRMQLRALLGRFESLSARSHSIAGDLREFSGGRDIDVIGDVMFSLRTIPVSHPDRGPKRIGIAPLRWRSGDEEKQVFDGIFAFCQQRLARSDTEIHVFCFSRGNDSDDEVVAQSIIEQISQSDRVFVHPATPDVLLSYSRLQVVDYLVSMRSTAAVAALLLGIPFAVMEKRASRGREIFTMLNREDALIDTTGIDAEALVAILGRREATPESRIRAGAETAKRWTDTQRTFARSVVAAGSRTIERQLMITGDGSQTNESEFERGNSAGAVSETGS